MKTMMVMFYCAFIESILSFSNSLSQFIKWSSRLIGESQRNLETLYLRKLQQLSSFMLNGDSHPLHTEVSSPNV